MNKVIKVLVVVSSIVAIATLTYSINGIVESRQRMDRAIERMDSIRVESIRVQHELDSLKSRVISAGGQSGEEL